jgi:hypothetical protein
MNIRLELELALRRHGWPLMLGLAVLSCTGVAMLFQLAPQGRAPDVVAATDGSRQLEMHHRAFRAVLIPRGELEARQRDVLASALRYGLAAGRIDYGFEARGTDQFGVATLKLPLRGNYTDFRSFLAAALAAQPALAIDDLSIQRIPGGNGVEARLKLAFLTANGMDSGR